MKQETSNGKVVERGTGIKGRNQRKSAGDQK